MGSAMKRCPVVLKRILLTDEQLEELKTAQKKMDRVR